MGPTGGNETEVNLTDLLRLNECLLNSYQMVDAFLLILMTGSDRPRLRGWKGCLKRQSPSKPSLLSIPGDQRSHSAEKLFTSLLIVCKERSSIHIYSVYFTVYLLWESPWIAYRVSLLYNNHAVMIDHPLRVKILWLSTINMLKVTMIWEHQQQWISRAIVIFFMQCGFAFLEAGSVRSASTSSSHHCQCFLVHIYKYISMLGIVHHLWTDNWSNWFWRNVNHSSLVKGCGGGKSFYIGKETNMEVFYILNISIQLVLEWKP